MTANWNFWRSTVGRKQVVALTGLGLSLFVLVHMAGNLLMFVSPQAYNEYGHSIVSNPLIYVIEVALAGIFLAHLAVAIGLQVRNHKARGQGYAVAASGDKGTSWVAKTMAIQGVIILVFVVLHLRTFKYGPRYEVNYGAGPIRDLYRLVVEVFNSPGYVGWYCVALVVLGLHLSHGIKSVLQTLGAHHPRYQRLIKFAAWGYAALVAGGFLAQPIYMFMFYQAQ